MADKKKPNDFIQSILMFTALIGICIWIGMIIAAKGEDRLAQACRPLEIGTDTLHEVATALTGTQPSWTLYVQQYVMAGCYYFFGVVLASFIPTNQTLEGDTGGLRY
jgi:hypothetical protein